MAYPITLTCIENTSWYLTGVASPENASWLTELWSKDFITKENWKDLNLENYIMVIIGLAFVCAFVLFMTISPLYTNLNREKEVPERVT